MRLAERLLSCRQMVKPEQLRGEIAPSKEIYKRTLQMAWPAAIESVLVTLVGAVWWVVLERKRLQRLESPTSPN